MLLLLPPLLAALAFLDYSDVQRVVFEVERAGLSKPSSNPYLIVLPILRRTMRLYRCGEGPSGTGWMMASLRPRARLARPPAAHRCNPKTQGRARKKRRHIHKPNVVVTPCPLLSSPFLSFPPPPSALALRPHTPQARQISPLFPCPHFFLPSLLQLGIALPAHAARGPP